MSVSACAGGSKALQTAVRPRRRPTLATACVCLLLALCGCSYGSDSHGDPASETAAAASEASQTAEAQVELTGPPMVGSAVWATALQPGSNEPLEPVTTIPETAPALYAVFPIERFPEGSTIRAEWTYNGTSLDGLGSEVQADRDRINGWVEFHLKRSGDEPWPDGVYAITLTAGDVLVATAEVEVVRS